VVGGQGGAPIAQLALELALRGHLDRRVTLHLRASVGYVVAGLDATVGGRAESGVGGPLVELALGVGLAP
jgi:hypothetical protein